MPDRNQAPRRVDQPQPGFFAVRLVRGGPKVGARIEYSEPAGWRCTIDGKAGNANPDPALADQVFSTWHHGEIIDEGEYTYLTKHSAWAKVHAPDSPAANPRKRLNLDALPPIF